MSVFRVITRIIPLNSSESTFEPASFDQLTDGNVGEVKVLNLTEPQSGMKYRIERIMHVQDVGPGESVESVNKAYAEKLKNIPGFVQFKSDEMPLNPYDKSFQVTLPKVLFGQPSDDSKSRKNKNSDSFRISVVKNFNFKKASSKPKICTKSAFVSSKIKKDAAHNDAKIKASKNQNDIKSPFKLKYPAYLSKKLKNSVWRNKKSFKNLKNKRMKNKYPNCSPEQLPSKDTTSHENPVTKTHNDSPGDSHFKKTNGDISSKDNDKRYFSDDDDDDFLELECGDLVINVPEAVEDLPENEGDTSAPKVNHSSIISDDSSLGDSSVSNQANCGNHSENVAENSFICNKFIIPDGHPAYELLIALKKYFVNGECLICGFMPTEKDFNGFEHMVMHTLSNSFTSSYKCSCCDEKFSNPRNLYMHALSREKSYKYMCDICLLKFKRKHYLSRHAAKSH